jgi:hypothetical protein
MVIDADLLITLRGRRHGLLGRSIVSRAETLQSAGEATRKGKAAKRTAWLTRAGSVRSSCRAALPPTGLAGSGAPSVAHRRRRPHQRPKNSRELARCRDHGIEGMQHWVGLSVLANNLIVLGKAPGREQRGCP